MLPNSRPNAPGVLTQPVAKPLPDAELAGEQESLPDSLVTPDMEEPAETNRPPLGN